MRTRRALLAGLAPLALGGCSLFNGDLFDDWFTVKKDPLPGTREAINVLQQRSDDTLVDTRPVTLPPAVANPSWELPGGDLTHAMGNPAGPVSLNRAWRASVGDGGGFRRRITAQPIVANDRVYTMDSDATVRAFALSDGGRAWSTDTTPEDDRSTNVGGGISYADGIVFAATGRSELLALDAATGAIKWRVPLPTPARSGPTIAKGVLFLPTVDSRLLARSASDGAALWSYDGSVSPASVLGAPAPAVVDDFVVAGFGGGDLVGLRAASGAVAWSETLGSMGGTLASADFSAVRGLPVVADGRVFAIGLGGQAVCMDLHSGRRLWTRTLTGGSTPWLAGDSLFVVTTDQHVVALARDNGATRWTAELPRYERPDRQKNPIIWFGPTMTNGQLVLVSSTSKLVMVDAVSGQVGELQDMPGAAQTAPTIAAGTLLNVTADSSLTAYR